MNILVLDFETYFDDDYTLKKMTTEAYIRDPRFECLGVGIRIPASEHFEASSDWFAGDEVPVFFGEIDWSDTAVLAHHAQFDGLILSHHFSITPALWLDTLSMARLMLGNHLSVALGALAAHYGLEAKTIDYSAATGFRGKRATNLTPADWTMLGDGCLHDVALTWDIFQRLAKGFPQDEYRVIDMTIRMFTEPRLVGDVALFEKIRDTEFLRKNEALLALGVSKVDLQSNTKFVVLLEAEGVEVEYKDGKNGPIPAVAKTDEFMRGLVDHEDDRIAALASARLEGKSTIDETRAGRLAGASRRGALPVYLGYCGAHTTRWSGGDKVNLQNLRRGTGLRSALLAPKGYLLAVADKSQIECRLLNYIAGQRDVIERFRAKEDLYVKLASKFYKREITRKDKAERGLGKLGELSCGYGAGGPSIVRTAAKGTYGPPVKLTDEEGLAFRDLYRGEHPHVVAFWRQCDNEFLPALAQGGRISTDWFEIRDGKIIGPTGVPMNYAIERRYDEFKGRYGYMRKTRRGWSGIWGGHLTENICQYLSRIDIAGSMLRIEKRLGPPIGRPVLTTHDDACWCLPASEAQAMFDEVILPEMKRSPPWMPGIPLDAEGGVAERYSDCKD